MSVTLNLSVTVSGESVEDVLSKLGSLGPLVAAGAASPAAAVSVTAEPPAADKPKATRAGKKAAEAPTPPTTPAADAKQDAADEKTEQKPAEAPAGAGFFDDAPSTATAEEVKAAAMQYAETFGMEHAATDLIEPLKAATGFGKMSELFAANDPAKNFLAKAAFHGMVAKNPHNRLLVKKAA